MKILLKYFLLVLNNVFFDINSMKDEEIFSKNQQNQNSKLFNVEYIDNLSIKDIEPLLIKIAEYINILISPDFTNLHDKLFSTAFIEMETGKTPNVRRRIHNDKTAIFRCCKDELALITVEKGIALLTQLTDYLNECLLIKRQDFWLQMEKEEHPYLFKKKSNQKLKLEEVSEKVNETLFIPEKIESKNEEIKEDIPEEKIATTEKHKILKKVNKKRRRITRLVNLQDSSILATISKILPGLERRVLITQVQLKVNVYVDSIRSLLEQYPEYKKENFNLVIDNVNKVNNNIYKILLEIEVILSLNTKTSKETELLEIFSKKIGDCQKLIGRSDEVFKNIVALTNKDGAVPRDKINAYNNACTRMFDVQTEISESINEIVENHQIVSPLRSQEKQALDSIYKLNKLKNAKK